MSFIMWPKLLMVIFIFARNESCVNNNDTNRLDSGCGSDLVSVLASVECLEDVASIQQYSCYPFISRSVPIKL